MYNLAIIVTHPIQYYTPLFKLLAEAKSVKLKVFYTWSQSKDKVKDRIFGKEIQWDIPLLEGYSYEFVVNVSQNPGSHHYRGIDNPTLIERVLDFQPHAILVFGWNFKSHLNLIRKLKGKIPIWFRGDSTLLGETSNLKTLIRRIALKWVYRHIDKAFYVGYANKAYFLKHGLKEEQLIYAPHAIDNERFKNSTINYEERAQLWRKELGFQESDLVVLFAGKFESVKQPILLADALLTTNNNFKSNLQLIFAGNGPMEAELKNRYKNESNIQFLPFQNQSKMPIVYRLGDVLCLPSKSETWGLSVNEAMACGKAVIVSDKVGCAIDLVKQGYNGEVFKHDSKDSLIQTLANLNHSRLIEFGVNGNKIIEDFNFNKIVVVIEKELNKISL